MSEVKAGLAVCIPTYRRPTLLRRLLDDLSRQSVLPEQVVVVDGDSAGNDVREVVKAARWAFPSVCYVPSNHANLPFQRYIGWLASSGYSWLVYLDDDLRIRRPYCLEGLLHPLVTRRGVVGVTASIQFPRRTDATGRPGVMARSFGSARSLGAGGLSPTGFRNVPVRNGNSYANVEWLRGGVMGFRRAALRDTYFPDALFALAETGGGLGEDTVLARHALSQGDLLLVHDLGIEHPDDDSTQAYATQGFKAGYALAYSRRLINDNYRGFKAPTWGDRFALGRHYLWTNLSNLVRVCRRPSRREISFGSGYAWGTIRGMFQEPCAERLTPGINWRADARSCLGRAVLYSEVAVCQ